jgi:flagellar biogenesis protein FliO
MRRIGGNGAPQEDEARDEGAADWELGWFDMLWPLVLVLGGIALLFWAARRYLPGMRRMTGSRAVTVLARTYLSPRQSINVVRLGRRILVVGQSADALSALGSISDPEEVSEIVGLCESAGESSSVSSFRKIFQRMDGEFAADNSAGGQDIGQEDLSRVRGQLDGLREKLHRLTGGRKEP